MSTSSSAAAGTFSDALQVLVSSMGDYTSGEGFQEATYAQVNDMRGGAQTTGQIVVRSTAVAGLYAYTGQAHVLNTAYLNNVEVTAALNVIIIVALITKSPCAGDGKGARDPTHGVAPTVFTEPLSDPTD
jgi:hypothetical protein